jgi:2,5-diamino-6-(ribosylamino)-4(3H)-pyrimidinone 5'-phosphate reductase
MRPHVVLHNQVSLDGRIDGFEPDMALHYETAGHWKFDVHMAGSDTLLACPDPIPPEEPGPPAPPDEDPNDDRALLVVPDSRGRVRSWHFWRQQPYWRGVHVLCTEATPADYYDYLRTRHIGHEIVGKDRVDLAEALRLLYARHNARTVLVDSGGTLNGLLLRAGLVDEVSVVVHPSLVGRSAGSIFREPDPHTAGPPIGLRPTHVETLGNDFVWLRYEVSPTKTEKP